jgi:ATP-dependent Zn protease
MDTNKRDVLFENLVLRKLDSQFRSEFDNLFAFKSMDNPLNVFTTKCKETSDYIKETKAVSAGELDLLPKHPDRRIQNLIDLSDPDFDKLDKLVRRHTDLVWGKAEKADLFRYCRAVDILPGDYTPEVRIYDDEAVSINDSSIFVLKVLYPNLFNSIIKLNSFMIFNPLKKLEDEKFAGEFMKMSINSYNEFLDTTRFWCGESDCSALLLYCRIMGYFSAPGIEPAQINYDWLSDEIIRRLDEKSKRLIFDLSSEIGGLQKFLLDNVKGQEHAVNTFCEGLFASEVLAAQKDRKGVKGLYLFAGPPGTGKSFLAEQAAEYLGRPYRVFDMTQYSAHEDQRGLIGSEYLYKDAQKGVLTSYVADNKNAVLVFDEIEKAHINTLHIFYDLLNNGTMTDKYMDTAHSAAKNESLKGEDSFRYAEFLSYTPTVSFKDTIIIFTSNAGRSLYEDGKQKNLSSIDKKTLLNALETEINPVTREPFFPTALVSRVATGFPLLFNHLKPYHLLEIMRSEYKHIAGLFEDMYGISMRVDDPNTVGDTHNVLVSILLSEGGMSDARTVKARASLFFKTRIHRAIQEIELNFKKSIDNLKSVIFKADLNEQPDEIKNLFSSNKKTRILLFAKGIFSKKCTEVFDNCEFLYASTFDEIKALSEEQDIDFAVIDISSEIGSDVFKTIRAAKPELPICILEFVMESMPIDGELISSYFRLGAYANIRFTKEGDFDDFKVQINDLCAEIYMLKNVEELSKKRKALAFNTETVVDGETAYIKLTDYQLKRVTDADDLKNLLSDSDIPSERFSDVIGAKRAKEELKFFIDFLKKPEKFSITGLKPPKGVLLYGPPGTGKTMLAKAMAGEAEVNFISQSANTFNTGYSGSGPKSVRDLFALARKYAPSIIFIDEIDFIGKARGTGNSITNEETLNALLTEMDGFSTDPKKPVFVLAATNYDVESGKGGIGTIDEALSRRFDSRILVDLPNAEERKELIEKELGKIKNHRVTASGIKTLAERSEVCRINPSNLVATINEAKRAAFKKTIADANFVLDDNTLLEAFEVVTSGEETQLEEKHLEKTARHETGHAVVYYLCGNLPAYITVVARSNYGGYMAHSLKDINNPFPTKKDLLGSVRTALGGYAAESICYGENDSDEGHSSGASSDLQNATNIVRNMITRYGMYEEFGLIVSTKESDELTALINKILREQLAITKELINNNRAMFDKVAAALIDKKKLTEQEFEEICNGTEKA